MRTLFNIFLTLFFLYGFYVSFSHLWVLYGWENLERVKFEKDPDLQCCYYKKFPDGSYLLDFRGKSPFWEHDWVIRCPKSCSVEMVLLNEDYYGYVEIFENGDRGE